MPSNVETKVKKKKHFVGYWKTSYLPKLPMPVAQDKKWLGQDIFIKKLEVVQKRAMVKKYKGFSSCRICKIPNGTNEYYYKDWVWPSGYIHYLKDHNVRLPIKFKDFIETEYELL